MADPRRRLALPGKSSVEREKPKPGWNEKYQANLDRLDEDTRLLKDGMKHPDPEFLFNLLSYLDWPFPKPEDIGESLKETADCAFIQGDLSGAIDRAMSLVDKFRELETDRLLRVRKGILAYAIASAAAAAKAG
ncbi:hypothetical protein LTR56_012864 [Elasticomyces elasticus]|nr:hypothetical protein LTR56_012864 [Elasticomyces elasticus]KAK3650790.1 hypothetical protein LTR22_012389 [Elasticomyces elasticus]KAK4918494.1 hypothetical protein LTR49_013727 [Elasticomyces elasticus]KAK5757868.1 hypothetical protein LTS12_012052 [Elasticomyces elasticus]